MTPSAEQALTYLSRLAARCPRLELAAEPVRPPRFVLRGFDSLELTVL